MSPFDRDVIYKCTKCIRISMIKVIHQKVSHSSMIILITAIVVLSTSIVSVYAPIS